jgi:hypothetical protein
MSLSTLLMLLSIGALLVSFLQALAKPDVDKHRWKTTVVLGLVLLCVNAGLEFGKRVSEARRGEAARRQESEQKLMVLNLASDLRSLNEEATAAFKELDAAIKSVPAATAAELGEKAHRLQTRLSAVTAAVEQGASDRSIEQLKQAIEEMRADIRELNTTAEVQRVKQPAIDHTRREGLADSSRLDRYANDPTDSNSPKGDRPSPSGGGDAGPNLDAAVSTNNAVMPLMPLTCEVHQSFGQKQFSVNTSQAAPSLLNGIQTGAVIADFVGTGGSAGESVKLTVLKGPKSAPGSQDYTIAPGSQLSGSEDCMIIRGVAGRTVGEDGYSPTSVITVPNKGSATYILDAFSTKLHTDNPSRDTHFTLSAPEPFLSCIAVSGKELSIDAFQVAVWIYTDNPTFSEVNDVFRINDFAWQEGETVFLHCQDLSR